MSKQPVVFVKDKLTNQTDVTIALLSTGTIAKTEKKGQLGQSRSEKNLTDFVVSSIEDIPHKGCNTDVSEEKGQQLHERKLD